MTTSWLKPGHFCAPANLARLGILLLFTVSGSASATTYFVRESGNDSASGDSPTTTWRTIGRVNQAHLHPGDRVAFQSGESFAGNLHLTAECSGTTNASVVINSTGDQPATLLAGTGTGIQVENAGGCALENLIIVGAGSTTNTGYGVRCDNTRPESVPLDYLRLANLEVRGFGQHGILVGGERGGFRHVLITNCVARENLRGGMEIAGRLPYDSPAYVHADVTITHCRAFDNTGDPNYMKNHSGSGIVLYQVDGGLMDHCTAWNNGGLCRSRTGGGVGLWTCSSRRVVIQHCESFRNRTSSADGGGFDIDGGSENCVLQYNYSHDNDGPGLMVYTYPYAQHPDRDNVVRFNISENDSRKSRTYAGLWVRSDGKGMTGVQIYNNTVQVGPWTDQAVYVDGNGVEAHLRNNIFIAKGRAVPLRAEKARERLRFENNLYWRDQAPFQIAWEGKEFASLEEWRNNTGQESVQGAPVGMAKNPALSPPPAEPQPEALPALNQLTAFRPLPGSPALTAGLDLRGKFGVEPGFCDFFGLALPPAGNSLLGAIGQPAPNLKQD